MLILSIQLTSLTSLADLNPTRGEIADTDIIGSYRVMTSTSMPFERFLECKKLQYVHKWKLPDLGKYLFYLPESRKSLLVTWNQTVSYTIPSSEKLAGFIPQAAVENAYHSLSKLNVAQGVTDEDIIAAYRVITGQPISIESFNMFKKHSDTDKWNYTMLANHLLVREESLANLNIPTLAHMEAFPIRLRNGMIIYGYRSDFFISQSIASTGYWEPHMERLMRAIVKPGDCVVDVGANIGYFTAILSELVGETGKVLSFEPLPPLVKLLEKAKETNKLKNVILHPVALSNNEGNVYIDVGTFNSGGGQFRSEEYMRSYNNLRPNSVVSVPTKKLDDLYYNKITRLDYLKMDVEGAEDLVLEGAKKLIKKFNPKITWEFSPRVYRDRGIDPLALLQEFVDLGYTIALVLEAFSAPNPVEFIKKNHLSPSQLMDRLNKTGGEQADIVLIKF